MGRKINLIRHISGEKLESLYKNEKDARKKERLLSIILLYDGPTFREAAKILNRESRALMVWKRRWNGQGPDGLDTRKQKGKPPVIPRSEREKAREEIAGKGMDIKQAAVYSMGRKRSASVFGFMAPEGNDVALAPDGSKTEDFRGSLRRSGKRIRTEGCQEKPCEVPGLRFHGLVSGGSVCRNVQGKEERVLQETGRTFICE